MNTEPTSMPSGTDADMNRAGTDPLEAAAVHAGWQLVDICERLGLAGARETFAPELEAWFRYARSTVPDLVPWPKVMVRKVYENDRNRLRFRRILDFVAPGDNVLDIGLGRGYQSGVLLRDGSLASYRGIDLEPRNIAATQQMIEVNQLTDVSVDLEVADMYELSADRVTGADLVICCEVLEHVPDPERALQILADALPEGTDLLISVPMLGRLEGVWGHCNVFDGRRVRAMVASAGLWVHHVEPLANQWTIALLSRDPKPSERATVAAHRRPAVPVSSLVPYRDFIRVEVDAQATPLGETAEGSTELQSVKTGVQCHLRGARRFFSRDGVRGGLSFPVESPHGLRLEFGIADFRNIDDLTVDAYDGSRRVARWSWSVQKRPIDKTKKTFLLYPDKSGGYFKAQQSAELVRADHVEVWANVKRGNSGVFTLTRAAYLH